MERRFRLSAFKDAVDLIITIVLLLIILNFSR